jgi:hypothetical protein
MHNPELNFPFDKAQNRNLLFQNLKGLFYIVICILFSPMTDQLHALEKKIPASYGQKVVLIPLN